MNDLGRSLHESPRNFGTLDAKSADVGSGTISSVETGDVIKIQLRVGAAGTIEAATFKAFGCGTAIACASHLTEIARGKTIAEATGIEEETLVTALDVDLPKRHLASIALAALSAAIDDYHAKHPELRGPRAEWSRAVKKAEASQDPEQAVRFLWNGVTVVGAERARVLAALSGAKPGDVFSEHYKVELWEPALGRVLAARETLGVLDQVASCVLADVVRQTGVLACELCGPVEEGQELARYLEGVFLPGLVGELRPGYAGFTGSGMYGLRHVPLAALSQRTVPEVDAAEGWSVELREGASRLAPGVDLVFLPRWMVVLGPGDDPRTIRGRIPGREIARKHVDMARMLR